MKSTTTHTAPLIIEYLREEDSHYNFNIIETIVEEEDNEPYSRYDYYQVFVANPVSKQKIKDAISLEYELVIWEEHIDKDCDELGIS